MFELTRRPIHALLGMLAAAAACQVTPADRSPTPEQAAAPPATEAVKPSAAPKDVIPAAAVVAPAPSACPEGMALIAGRFCIDRWEASTQRQDGKLHSAYHAVDSEPVLAISRQGLVPQAYISMDQADAACRRSSKRLCSTAEWLDACRGTQKPLRDYPYGVKEQRGACNADQGGHPLMLLHAGRRPTDSFWMNDPRINQLGGTLAPAGAFDDCRTPEGVHDMVGNLLEWTRGDRPLLMGGYYLDTHENHDGCRYVTMRHGAEYHDYSTGFRCCAKPDAEALEAAKGAAAVTPVSSVKTSRSDDSSGSRDPKGLRSFEHAAAALPSVPPPPAYDPADAACPVDMQLVSGERCTVPVQECLRWADEPGKPQRACAEFKSPSRCTGQKRSMRYCIDRYEYTPPGYELPLVHVAWNEAQHICRKLEKRLCMEDEWEFACEGEQAQPYPYGYQRDGAACNHDLPELFTPRAKLIDKRVPAKSLPGCESPFGVFNLVGNVDEWTSRPGNEPPWRSILRGGWWLTGRNRCRAATESHNEIYAGPQTGFRCCKPAR